MDGKVLMDAVVHSNESVKARFDELGMIQQRTVIDALGYYVLSTGRRGRWTTVEVYPKFPVTSEVSPISIDEDLRESELVIAHHNGGCIVSILAHWVTRPAGLP